MRRFILGLAVFLVAHGTGWAQIADGTPVTIDWLFPDNATVYGSASKVVGLGVEVNCPGSSGAGDTPQICSSVNGGPFTIDVANSSIALNVNNNNWGPAPFNGFRVTFPGTAAVITGATVTTGDPAFSPASVQFTDHSASINLVGNNSAYTYTINLTFATTPVAVPTLSQLGVLMLGLLLSVAVAGRLRGRQA